jgi:hypothetical protein
MPLSSRDGPGFKHAARSSLLLFLCFWHASADAGIAQESEQHGDIDVGVVLDPTEQSGHALATVRIHAAPEIVWRLITDCKEALVLVPGLEACQVIETARDGSWQRIHHVLNYSWYVPKLTYEILARYQPPTRVEVERTSGDLKRLAVSWTLTRSGGDTIARYQVDLEPGFWVPHWMVRGALKRDLPKMLRALRDRAEAPQHP